MWLLCLAQIIHPALNGNALTDISWTFALYLEAVAVFPQIYMFFKKVLCGLLDCQSVAHWGAYLGHNSGPRG